MFTNGHFSVELENLFKSVAFFMQNYDDPDAKEIARNSHYV